MNAWSALTKKEFRLGLPVFLIAVILFGGIIAIGYYIGHRVGYEKELVMGALSGVLGFHILYLVFYLIYTLNAERKRLHLWLHTPMPIAGLLISKLATGILYMCITFIPTLIFANNFFNANLGFLNDKSAINILGLSSVGIFTSALWIAVVFIFFWSIFLTFSQRMNDFLSFITTFALFVLLGFVYDLFINLSFIQMLTDWGAITANDIITGIEFEFEMMEEDFEAETIMETSIFYIGHFVRDLIAAVIMFFGACWIIDRKVEV